MTRSDRPQSSRIVLCLALVAMLLAWPRAVHAQQQGFNNYAGKSVIRAVIGSEAQLQQMLEICPMTYSCHFGVGTIDLVADRRQQQQLRQIGVEFDVRIADLGPRIAAERARLEQAQQGGVAGGPFFNDFKTYDQIMTQLDVLANARPDLAQVSTIGTTFEGRAIKAIRISGSAETKPAFVITGCQHAREWISPMTATYIANELINGYNSDPEIQQLLDSLEIHVIPIVNPDGYVYSWGPERLWRKNRKPNGDGTFGVDLNRNWEIGFGGPSTSQNTNAEVYPGPAPFSELETQAVRDYILARPNVVSHLDLHSYSQLVLQPWAHTNDTPPSYDCIHEVGDAMSHAILGVHGKHYPNGSGNSVIYLAGGTIIDWMFGDQNLLSLLIELRPDSMNPGFILPPDQIIPTGQETFQAVLAQARASLGEIYLTIHLGLPQFAKANTTTPMRIAVIELSSGPITAGSGRIFTRVGDTGPFNESVISPIGDGNYKTLLPAAPCGETIQFYFQFQSAAAGTFTFPAGGASEPYEVLAQDMHVVLDDDMETNMGWKVGAAGDTATTGIWERIAPNQTINSSGVPAQPGTDNPDDEGSMCWFTGQDAGPFSGSNDVDGGSTTLTSPQLDASRTGDAYITYFRWYSNNTGSNPNTESMIVEISNNNGATWTLLEEVTFNEAKWTKVSFRIADFLQPTDSMRLRFIARDDPNNGGAIVEAGIDTIDIVVVDCDDILACPGDIVSSGTFQPPPDGLVNGADLAYLLSAWGPNPGSPADLVTSATFAPPPDGLVDGADLGALLGAWGACP